MNNNEINNQNEQPQINNNLNGNGQIVQPKTVQGSIESQAPINTVDKVNNNYEQPQNNFNQQQLNSANSMQSQPTQFQTPNPNNNTFANQNTYNQTGNKNINAKKYAKVSLILGIISIISEIFTKVPMFPVAIVGLIFGIISVKNKEKGLVGVILNGIAIVISIIMLIAILSSSDFKDFKNKLFNELDYATSDNYIAGKYNCTGVDSNTDKYLITLHLNKDNTFLYGPYGDTEKNHAKGTYTFEDEKKTNHSGDYRYFMVTLTGPKEDFIQNGVEVGEDFKSQMEIGLTKKNGKKSGVIMFLSSYNMYYCYAE